MTGFWVMGGAALAGAACFFVLQHLLERRRGADFPIWPLMAAVGLLLFGTSMSLAALIGGEMQER